MTPLANTAASARNGVHGYLRLITTVYRSGVCTFLIATSRKPQPLSCCRASSNENLTSAEVIGCPFEKRTSRRSLNVYLLPSGVTVWPVASQGRTFLPSGVAV